MNAKSMILGLAPWFVFAWAAERLGADHVTLAAMAACALALVVTIYEAVRTKGGWKIIDVAGVILFGVIALIGLLGDHQVDETLVYFGRGGSAFVLAAVMAISAFTVPFTEQYARETVDPAFWHTPTFRAKNRKISLLWAAAIGLMGCAHLVAGILASTASVPGSHPGNILLNWVVPIALIVFAVKRTKAIAGDVPSTPAEQSSQNAG